MFQNRPRIISAEEDSDEEEQEKEEQEKEPEIRVGPRGKKQTQ